MADRLELEAEHPDAEIQTDKDTAKILPCANCQAELIVSMFYAAANARCAECKGLASQPGQGGVVTPGKTNPADARDLMDCLLHKSFGAMVCPVDCEHGPMELKSVSHNPRYGPSSFFGYVKGEPVYKQDGPGETTMLQCNSCKCCVSFSTTAQSVFRRVNEISTFKHVNNWGREDLGLGIREEAA